MAKLNLQALQNNVMQNSKDIISKDVFIEENMIKNEEKVKNTNYKKPKISLGLVRKNVELYKEMEENTISLKSINNDNNSKPKISLGLKKETKKEEINIINIDEEKKDIINEKIEETKKEDLILTEIVIKEEKNQEKVFSLSDGDTNVNLIIQKEEDIFGNYIPTFDSKTKGKMRKEEEIKKKEEKKIKIDEKENIENKDIDSKNILLDKEIKNKQTENKNNIKETPLKKYKSKNIIKKTSIAGIFMLSIVGLGYLYTGIKGEKIENINSNINQINNSKIENKIDTQTINTQKDITKNQENIVQQDNTIYVNQKIEEKIYIVDEKDIIKKRLYKYFIKK